MGVKSGTNGYGDWTITKPKHWIYEGLGANEGDRIRGLVGWEYNWIPATDIPGLEVVATAPLNPRILSGPKIKGTMPSCTLANKATGSSMQEPSGGQRA